MSKKIKVQIVSAFTENSKGGNPAGVVLEADFLTKDEKLRVAKEVGLSETAFVSSSNRADFKLEFFTPNRQIAHCGHATIATFAYLNQLKKIINPSTSKETIDGVRKIMLQGDSPFMEQLAPRYKAVDSSHEKILTSLGIQQSDLLADAKPMVVNTGNSFLLVGVQSKEVLQNLTPDFELIHQVSDQYDLIGYYPFVLENDDSYDASTRMFAPRYGISEESGTGMAAGPLACYLYDLLQIQKTKYQIRQGAFMRPPSASRLTVELELSNSTITSLMAGGTATVVKSFTLSV